MISSTLIATLLFCGCGGTDHPPDHPHEHGGEDGHTHGSAAASPDAETAAASASMEVPAFSLGSLTATLEPSADRLRLAARDASGAAVSPTGEARIVLTGTGEAEQRVVLTAGDGAWSGSARAVGASGYVAVVSLPVDGHTETARVTWGAVPATPPTGDQDDHGHHGDAGHGHDGGAGHDGHGGHGHDGGHTH